MSPKAALLDGMRRLEMELPPHRFWWYHRLLFMCLNRHWAEHLFQIICVLVLIREELQNKQISDEKIEEVVRKYDPTKSIPRRNLQLRTWVIREFNDLHIPDYWRRSKSQVIVVFAKY